jgi:NagD protein
MHPRAAEAEVMMNDIATIRGKAGFIIDMDGVVYHGDRLLPGAREFVGWLRTEKKKFLFLTNSSSRTPRELQHKMKRLGVDVGEEHFYTSALATAAFLSSQQPGGSAFVIGDAGLVNALYDAGFTMNEVSPDYVVVGETVSYNYERICRAVDLVLKGAKLVGANPDVTGPVEDGVIPATGALMAPIELATGSKAYYVGKPNPLIMRHALKKLDCRREEAAIIGDRMDTDIIAGIEAGIETVLVLSGVTAEADLRRFAYRPHHVLNSIGDLVALPS